MHSGAFLKSSLISGLRVISLGFVTLCHNLPLWSSTVPRKHQHESAISLSCLLSTSLFPAFPALTSVLKLGAYLVFTFVIPLNSNFISMSHSASNSSALPTPCCSPRVVSLFPCSRCWVCCTPLRSAKTRVHWTMKIVPSCPCQASGKVEIIVSLPAANTVLTTSNDLLGKFNF